VQTYPIRKAPKTKNQYILPAAMLIITILLISVVSSMAIPDPLGTSIQKHIEENAKYHRK